MIATLILIFFLLITIMMRKNGVNLAKDGNIHGLFVILISKMLFWFTLIEITHIWWKEALFYILPSSLFLFILYLFLERRFFIRTIKNKNE